jgi:hypothetical protein
MGGDLVDLRLSRKRFRGVCRDRWGNRAMKLPLHVGVAWKYVQRLVLRG